MVGVAACRGVHHLVGDVRQQLGATAERDLAHVPEPTTAAQLARAGGAASRPPRPPPRRRGRPWPARGCRPRRSGRRRTRRRAAERRDRPRCSMVVAGSRLAFRAPVAVARNDSCPCACSAATRASCSRRSSDAFTSSRMRRSVMSVATPTMRSARPATSSTGRPRRLDPADLAIGPAEAVQRVEVATLLERLIGRLVERVAVLLEDQRGVVVDAAVELVQATHAQQGGRRGRSSGRRRPTPRCRGRRPPATGRAGCCSPAARPRSCAAGWPGRRRCRPTGGSGRRRRSSPEGRRWRRRAPPTAGPPNRSSAVSPAPVGVDAVL